MQNLQKSSILIILFILLSNTLPAKDFIKPFEVKLKYSRHTTGKFYDYSGKSFLNLEEEKYSPKVDTLTYKTDTTDLVIDTIGWESRDYSFEYLKHSVEVGLTYTPNKFLTLQATIPISYYYLEEKWGTVGLDDGERITYAGGETKEKYSLTRLDYFGLDCEGYAFNDKFILGIRGSLYIPFGGDTSIQITPENLFLSDGYLDARTGPILGFRHKNIRFTTEILYNYRGEEPIDNLLIHSTFAFSTVPNTEMRVMLIYAKSLEPYKDDYKFITTRENIWEEYLDIGFEVKMKFTENINGYGGYRLRFYNKNNWNTGMFWLTGSYIF
jgi:hypothetical protein